MSFLLALGGSGDVSAQVQISGGKKSLLITCKTLIGLVGKYIVGLQQLVTLFYWKKILWIYISRGFSFPYIQFDTLLLFKSNC